MVENTQLENKKIEKITAVNKMYPDLTDFIIHQRASCYRLAYSYMKNKQDALDVVQESICKALSAKKKPVHPGDIQPWFYRIIINTAIDMLRRSHRITQMSFEDIEILSPPTEDQYQDMDLMEAVDSLPIKEKTLIILRFFEGMKIAHIADIMEENINTTKTRLYSCLKKLRIELEDDDKSGGDNE